MSMEHTKAESVSSFAYEVGAKGDVKPSIKVYDADVARAESKTAEVLKRALARIKNGEFQ